MKRLFASALAMGLVATTGLASAQTYRSASSTPYYGQGSNVHYDYARVIRVDPVFDPRYGSNYPTSGSQRCYERQTYVGADGYNNGGYTNGSYNNGGYGDYGRSDGYYDQYGNYRRGSGGTQAGATVATVVGGIIGAAVGSQVGGGSARYATSAIGSMVGGMAGRQVYEQSQRERALQAFKAGSQLVVKGTSQRGTDTTDTYSLSGATAAMNAIDAACA